MPDTGNIAISVEGISKNFRIPHEKHTTVKAAALNLFRRTEYSTLQALKDVSFQVREGEFFGIIGRNGCGKSTLLKIIAGIYVPTHGKIDVNGRVSPFLELGVGFNPELTARENVYLNGAILGLTKREIDEKFDEIIRFAELEDFVDMKIQNFSSGMHVRLAFSIAIRAHAEILLIDEVLAVGDANFQEKCIREFKKFKEEKRTILFVTHGMDMVERFCDRVLLLDRGEKKEIGDPGKVALEYGKLNILEKEKEDRLSNNESLVSEKDRKVEINDVKCLDDNGEQRRVFDTGEDITVRIDYSAVRPVEKPVFGVAVFNDVGVMVTGPNTKASGIGIDKVEGDGSIELKIRNNPFSAGGYYTTIVVYDWEMTNPLGYRDKAYRFMVKSVEKKYGGVVRVDTQWKN